MFKWCFSFQAFCRQTNRKSLNHEVFLILKRRILFFGHISLMCVCVSVCVYLCSCHQLRRHVLTRQLWRPQEESGSGKRSLSMCVYIFVWVCVCVHVCVNVCEPVWLFISQARTEKDVSPLPPLPLHLLYHPYCCLFFLFAYFIIHISIALCGSYRLYTLTTEL